MQHRVGNVERGSTYVLESLKLFWLKPSSSRVPLTVEDGTTLVLTRAV
ncbi:MAG: hypothetical protein RBJ76_11320 [Stenomitos frigidus ULC029]